MEGLEVDVDPEHRKQNVAQRKLLVCAVVCFFCAALLIAIVIAVILVYNREDRIRNKAVENQHESSELFNARSSFITPDSLPTSTHQDYVIHSVSKPQDTKIRPSTSNNFMMSETSFVSSTFLLSSSEIFSQTSIEISSTEYSFVQSSTQTDFLLVTTSYLTTSVSAMPLMSSPHSYISAESVISPSPSKEFTDHPFTEISVTTNYPPITLPDCKADEFRCLSGQCVLGSARCNKFTQCQDKSDEYNCSNCLGFQCNSGLCLWSYTGQCNGRVECEDLSDEANCVGLPNQRRCRNGVWVADYKWCDGVDNCYDNSDELNCTCNLAYEVECGNGKCIRREWVCDGYMDCNTDEIGCGNCNSEEFTCPGYMCINKTQVCDGENDCDDGWDEANCFSLVSESADGLYDLQTLMRGHNYSICSSNWTNEWSNMACQTIGYKEQTRTDYVSISWLNPNHSKTHGGPGYLTVTESPSSSNILTVSMLAVIDQCDSNKTVRLSCKSKECGMRSSDTVVPFIAGGDLVPRGRWPWVVSLSYLGRPMCGGVLIDSQWVLTAGHCVAIAGVFNYSNTPNFIEVLLGSNTRSRLPPLGGYRLRSDRIYHHPNLTWTGLGPIFWDVALVRLEKPVKFTSYVQPICLPKLEESFLSHVDTCFLAGWGYIGFNQEVTALKLREAKLQIWRKEDCRNNTVALETIVDTNFTICAGYSQGVLSGCQGDSGGPLMCLSDRGRWTVAGVMSSGSNVCGMQSNLADRFTNVSAVMGWIQQILDFHV